MRREAPDTEITCFVLGRWDNQSCGVTVAPSGASEFRVRLRGTILVVLGLALFGAACRAAPYQPTFYSIPSAARLYPYIMKPDPDPNKSTGPYTVVVDYTDPSGVSNLQHAYLQIKGDGLAQTLMH